MAYLLRAKKNIEVQDINEFKAKKERYLKRRRLKNDVLESAKNFEPNGVFGGQIAPLALQKHNNESAFVRYAEYTGTFSVPGTDHAVRSEFVRKQLRLMRSGVRSRPVLVIVTNKGVKVTDKRGHSLLMAHALHRISYCTCVPDDKLFCFLSREPRGPVNIQFCHVFTGTKSSQVEELNTILGNAFKAAHSAQKKAPNTFNERIAEKLEEQRQLYEEVQRRSEKEKARNKMLMNANLDTLPGEKGGSEMRESRYRVLLEKYSWYQPDTTREKALDYLLKRPVGSFVIRESTRHNNCYALTMRVQKSDNPSGISHYLIEKVVDGVRFKGLDKEWSNLASMVVHLSITPELLPCTLQLPEKMTASTRNS